MAFMEKKAEARPSVMIMDGGRKGLGWVGWCRTRMWRGKREGGEGGGRRIKGENKGWSGRRAKGVGLGGVV